MTFHLILQLLVLASPFVGLYVLLNVALSRKIGITSPREDSFEFVTSGEDLQRILVNSSDDTERHYCPSRECVIEGLDPRRPSIENALRPFGAWWVGLPPRQVHTFDIDKTTILPESERGSSGLASWIKHETEEVTSLRKFFPRFIYIEGVELKDGTKLNLIVQPDFEVINPRIPVMHYKGSFFPLLDASVSGAVGDRLNGLIYRGDDTDEIDPNGWLRQEKGRPDTPDMLKLCAFINGCAEDALASEWCNGYLVKHYGILARGVKIVAHDLSGISAEMAIAVQAQKLEREKAKGVVETAKGVAEAMRTTAAAEQARIEMLIKAGITPAEAAHMLRLEKLGGGVSTYVEGGAGHNVSIPL